MRKTASSRVKNLTVIGVSATLFACGIGDDFVSGFGNGGNHFYASPVIDELAEQLAGSAAVPPVTDEMLRTAFDAIAAGAADGDAEAALILFRVAEAQREADE